MPTGCGTDLQALYPEVLPRRRLSTDLTSCTWINNTLRSIIGRLNTLCMNLEALLEFTTKDIERLHKARILRQKIHHAINELAPALERFSVEEYRVRIRAQTALMKQESRIDYLWMDAATGKAVECEEDQLPEPNEFDAMFPGFPGLARQVKGEVDAEMVPVRCQLSDCWVERGKLNRTIMGDYREARGFLDAIRAEKRGDVPR